MCKISVGRMAFLSIGRRSTVMDVRREFFSDRKKKADKENEMTLSKSRAYAVITKLWPPKPVKTPVVVSNPVYTNLMTLSVCGSVIVLLAYIIFIKQPSELNDIFELPPEEFVALADRNLLRKQIRRKKAAGEDVALMEAELSLVNSQIDEIRSRPKKVAS